MIDLKLHSDGVLLPVTAQPGARINSVRGEYVGRLKVSVTQVAEKGKANQAILALLAKELQLRKNQLELVSGDTSSEKLFLVRDCELALLEQKLQWALSEKSRKSC